MKSYPEIANYSPEDLLEASMPHGTEPGQFYADDFEKKRIYTFSFEVEHDDHRNDVGSISFLADNKIIDENFEVVLQELLSFMKEKNLLTWENLETALPEILDGFNKGNNFTIGKYKFELKKILKKHNISITKEIRVQKGGLM